MEEIMNMQFIWISLAMRYIFMSCHILAVVKDWNQNNISDISY